MLMLRLPSSGAPQFLGGNATSLTQAMVSVDAVGKMNSDIDMRVRYIETQLFTMASTLSRVNGMVAKCPAHSHGASMAAAQGCFCNPGCSGVLLPTVATPFCKGECTPANCPANSHGSSVESGCTCGAGCSGSIVASMQPPYYSGICTCTLAPTTSPTTSPMYSLRSECRKKLHGAVFSSTW